MSAPRRTALYEEHVRAGGRMVDFAGWELPVQYSGLADEHLACRKAAGLFDVSHMGEFLLEGLDAESFLNFAVTNNVAKVAVGQAQYTALCNEHGGIVDDLVLYRQAPNRFFIVVNASNTEKDFLHLQNLSKKFKSGAGRFTLSNVSSNYTQIALQGRFSEKILQPLASLNLPDIKTYWFAEGLLLGGIPALIGRTGYTGEDGFELYIPWKEGPTVWRALLESGAPYGLKPCGLGARDTLRTEMKYPLYGQELTDSTLPLEAGLAWVTKLDKSEFVGKEQNLTAKSAGLTRKLVGFKLKARGIPRPHYKIYSEDGQKLIGEVTSGTHSPSLNEAIGIGYVESQYSNEGSSFTIDIRGQKIPAYVCATPFYKRDY